MARIRTIKPEYFRSRSLAKCPPLARLTFAGLWTEADDHGRGIADPRLIKGAVWPLDDDITHLHVSAHLDVLAETGHIRLYQVDEETYYQVTNWEKHQAAAYRRGDAKYPPVSAGQPVKQDSASPGVQESANHTPGSAGTRNREQGTGTGKQPCPPASPPDDSEPPALIEAPQPTPEPGRDDDPDWLTFWSAYPRKDAKKSARKAWRSAVKGAKAVDIITGARRYANDPNRAAPFTAMAATWLNAGRWDDEPLPARTSAAGYRPYQDPDPADYHGDL